MTNIVRWDPFTDLRQTMDQLFEQGFSRPWRYLQSDNYEMTLPVEVWATDEAVEVKAALPGVRPEDVDITVVHDVLTIKARHLDDAGEEKRSYHSREIAYGDMGRSFTLPVSVDSDKAEARFENGMLFLRLPKSEALRPKQIKISSPANGNYLN
jgi:HSP20 family protein